MRNITKKLLLILFSTLFSLAICEIALRLVGYRFTGMLTTTDPLLGWSLRPGASAWEADEGVAWTKINSHGYRDRERTISKPQGVYRVAVLGDSYTEARQVDIDKTFTWLAEEELNRRNCCGGRKVEVLNFGVLGYSLSQELILLRERVWKFSPDMVVLQFFTGNDIFDNHRALNTILPELAPYFLLKNGKLELDDSFRRGHRFNPAYIKLKGIAADTMNSSVLALMVQKLFRVRAQREERARFMKNLADLNAPPSHWSRDIYVPPTTPQMVEAWQVTEAVISEIDKEVRSHRVPLLMLMIPTEFQINPSPEELEVILARYKVDSLEYTDDRVEQLVRANRIPVLRLSKPLLEEARRTGTYMAGFANTPPNIGHLNERGHIVVTRELVQAVCEIAAAEGSKR